MNSFNESSSRSDSLDDILAKKGIILPKPAKIVKRMKADVYSLSLAQKRLWLFEQLEPNTSVYTIPIAFELKGHVNIPILEQCFNLLTAKHESFRTIFVQHDYEPKQELLSDVHFRLASIDLRNMQLSERHSIKDQIISTEVKKPFDLITAPPFRACIILMEDDHSILLITMHHLIADGWSIGLLNSQMSEFYKTLQEGKIVQLPELQLQYIDFSEWQHEWLQGALVEHQLQYWKQKLIDFPPVLQLPTDYVRPIKRTYTGAHYKLYIPLYISSALKALSYQENVTLFTVLLAAFQVLLYRYTGQEDIVIGTPVAGRTKIETEDMIGFFVNTLLIRANLSGNPTFVSFLQQLHGVCLDAYDNQDLPFERIVEEVATQRTPYANPLFQEMFALQNVPTPPLKLANTEVIPIEDVSTGTAKFDLFLHLTESRDGLRGGIEFNTSIFKQETIARLAGHFQNILVSLANNPLQPISEISMLTQEERSLILNTWNAPKIYSRKDQCLHQIFEQKASFSPDAIAMSYDSRYLTYAMLNRKANQLGHYLQELGVKPEVVVGICIDRSFDVIIGILAILKAGGMYLPIDPLQPQERIAFILKDASITILLCKQKEVPYTLKMNYGSLRVLVLDDGSIYYENQSEENIRSTVIPAHSAYVIYTSGSTGKPKGVVVTHTNAVQLLKAGEVRFKFSSFDVWTLFHSCAFDFSVWEIWGALLYGGRLVIIPHLVTRSPQAFYEIVSLENVTVLNQTPSAFYQLIRFERSLSQTATMKSLLSLRLVIFGGETLDMHSLQDWFQQHPGDLPQLINMYGITETTVLTTFFPLLQAAIQTDYGSVIGKPLPNAQVYILDKAMQLLPIGVPGEIHIGGDGISRGYLNRPDLTAQRFVPNIFALHLGERLYKSGDWGRFLPDGNIEFLGRIDFQVKIRGFRIELGEIEAILSQHNDVHECVVVVREDPFVGHQLIAFVTEKVQGSATSIELRSYLKDKLPEYMVPGIVVIIDLLPLTSNGKTDRAALLHRALDIQETPLTYIAPKTQIEKTIEKAWQEVLGLDRVSLHENFFDLGGHSLSIVKLHSKLIAPFKSLTIVDLFNYPTIGSLAKYLVSREKSVTEALPQVQRAEVRVESHKRIHQMRQSHRQTKNAKGK